jgi:serine protease AprX
MNKRVQSFFIVLIFLLILNTFAPLGTSLQAASRVQPQVVTIAREAPGQVVTVIIQQAVGTDRLNEKISRLGGKVRGDLSIIHALVADMPAGAAVALSADPTVKWVSLDAAVQSTACSQCVDTANLKNAYIGAIRASQVWNNAPYLQGQNIGIAIVDSGLNPSGDFYTVMGVNRQIANVRFNSDYNQATTDGYGHGSHVASIAGGNGRDSNGQYIGVAPASNVVNVKVSNDDGSSRMSDVIQGLQYVLNNKAAYNIRVVNLSINSSVYESYNTSPLDAAVEILWFNGIVVVVSAGNNGSNTLYPPANDPFVITVGATDDKGTSSISDDTIASFSAYGVSENNAAKPDLVAPGKNIVAHMYNSGMGLSLAHPANVVNAQYFRMSGTSMAAPMVTGAVALLLQDEPKLTPDQVKYRLKATANKSWPGYNAAKAGAGYLDVYAAITGTSTQSSNTGTQASGLLTTGSSPITWNSVGWNSVGWNSVGWNSVGWNSVGWNSVGWNSDYWGN